MKTLAAINPLRSFRAAYGLFIVMPLFLFAELFVFGWMTIHLALVFTTDEAIGVISFIGQTLLFQALILLGAGLPTWHWFQQLRQSRRNWRGVTIVVIALIHYLVLQWWCTLVFAALSKYVRNGW